MSTTLLTHPTPLSQSQPLPQRSVLRRLGLWALPLLAGLSLSGCETMSGGGTAGLGNVVSAISTAVGGTGSSAGGNSGLQDMLQGASAVFKDYNAAEQQVLGQEFAAVLLGAAPLVRNDQVQRYVNQVGSWVALQAELPRDSAGQPMPLAWRFGVIDSPAVNAWATPGGWVFITKGLMQRMDSEAELAGVLGHEIAHVVRGHYLKALKKGGFMQAAGGLVMHQTGQKQLNQVVVNAARNIYAKGLDQSDEFDADRYGQLYAARAGYAPGGLASVLGMYAAGSAQDAQFTTLFNTHPAPQRRLDRLQPLLAQAAYAQAGALSNEQRYRQIRKLL